MKPIAKYLFVPAVLLSFSLISYAQNDKDDAYRQFLNQRNKEYSDWRAKANSEFTDYLAKAWEEFKVQSGKADPMGPVPEKPTYYDVTAENNPSFHGLPASDNMCLPAVSPALSFSAEYIPAEDAVNVDFFGVGMSVPFNQGMKLGRVEANEKSVSNAWSFLSNSPFLPTVEALNKLKTDYSLNDWAVYMVVKTLTDAVYEENMVNQKVATQLFLLLQMQYKIRVGSAGNDLVLLIPFKEPVYQVSYVNDDKLDLFIYGYTRLSSQTPLFTFPDDFSQAVNVFSLAYTKPMKIGGAEEYKKIKQPLWSSVLGDDFSVPVNQPYISFALDYPQSDLVTYHRSAVDSETAKAVLRAVKYNILKEGMNSEQAVGYILSLIQKGFEYKTDYELFGRSKPMFIEESFYYGANNCKDRVLIFSWLVKRTLGLKTIMLGYPNHVACGVEFDAPVKGDSFSYKGHNYVMCDPTYIGAPIGATMPKFKDMTPAYIEP